MKMKQCKLTNETSELITWIPDYGARVGSFFTLDTKVAAMGGIWKVVEVYDTIMTDEQLKITEKLNRTYSKRTDI